MVCYINGLLGLRPYKWSYNPIYNVDGLHATLYGSSQKHGARCKTYVGDPRLHGIATLQFTRVEPQKHRRLDLWKMILSGSGSPSENGTLQGTNISHLEKRKIIFKSDFLWDMLGPRKVMEPEYYAVEVIGHPNHHLRIMTGFLRIQS